MAKNLRSGKKRVGAYGTEQATTGGPARLSTSLLESVHAEAERLRRENEELLANLEQDRRISLRGNDAEQLLEEQRRIQEDLQAELELRVGRKVCAAGGATDESVDGRGVGTTAHGGRPSSQVRRQRRAIFAAAARAARTVPELAKPYWCTHDLPTRER